jgi:hypothetical protein
MLEEIKALLPLINQGGAALAQCTGDLRFANQRLIYSRSWYEQRRSDYAGKKK